MADPLALWHADHVDFARLLDLLDTQVTAFRTGKRPNYELMIDIVQYLRAFGDRLHHPREDVAFARLVARDPALQLVTNRLLQEHRVIATAGEGLRQRLDAALEDIVTPRQAIEAAADLYLMYYRHHLAKEEREVVPRAKELLTREDWAAVAAVPGGHDPLFGDNLETHFRGLRREIAVKARAEQ